MQEGFRLSVSLSAAISSWVPQVVPSEAREEMDDTAGKMVKGKWSQGLSPGHVGGAGWGQDGREENLGGEDLAQGSKSHPVCREPGLQESAAGLQPPGPVTWGCCAWMQSPQSPVPPDREVVGRLSASTASRGRAEGHGGTGPGAARSSAMQAMPCAQGAQAAQGRGPCFKA